jgi:uncharacterized BrkB/YihY/UPF0761 family membrane protein
MTSPPKHWQQGLRFCKRLFGLFAQNLGRAIKRYGLIDGEQCAASFAYYAFFSLFPLILVCVAMATLFVQDRELTAAQILVQVDQYLPLQESDRALILHTVQGVLEHGLGASVLGFLVLTWSSLRFSQALVIGVNRAWEIERLQLVETPAKKPADDRDRYQRNRAWTGHAVRIRQTG